MKVAQIMERNLCGYVVRQNHQTGYLNANDLEVCGNELRQKEGLKRRAMNNYFQTDTTKEFLVEVAMEEGLAVEELKEVKRGRGGGQYIHPLVFLDMAMWFSPKLKVKVLKWFYDNLLLYRDNSGESFKGMNKALNDHYPMAPSIYSKIANRIATACGVEPFKKDRWNSATEEQLALRDKIQSNIELLAGMSDDIAFVVSEGIRKAK